MLTVQTWHPWNNVHASSDIFGASVNDHLKVFERRVSAEPGAATPLRLCDVRLKAATDALCYEFTRYGGPFSSTSICILRSTGITCCWRPFAALALFGSKIELSHTAIVGVRREERNWSPARCHVCSQQAHAMAPKQLHDGTMTLSIWNLVYLTLQVFPSHCLPLSWISFRMWSSQCQFN